MGSRTWIKIYCDKWLTGTLREETPQLRGIWADVLALAGNLTYGDTGKISLPNGVPLTDEQIAGVLKIKLKEWTEAKERLLATDRLTVKDEVISVSNWGKYQSEYDRQKKYRDKLLPKVTTQSTSQCRPEKEKEKEKEKERKPKKTSCSRNSKPEFLERVEKLKSLILQNNPSAKVKDLKWGDVVRLMVERDKRTLEEIDALIEFSQGEEFEKIIILSMGKVRKHFDRLTLKMKRGEKKRSQPWEDEIR